MLNWSGSSPTRSLARRRGLISACLRLRGVRDARLGPVSDALALASRSDHAAGDVDPGGTGPRPAQGRGREAVPDDEAPGDRPPRRCRLPSPPATPVTTIDLTTAAAPTNGRIPEPGPPTSCSSPPNCRSPSTFPGLRGAVDGPWNGRGVLVCAPTGPARPSSGVRGAPGPGGRPQVLLHHTHQGAEQPEAQRSGPATAPNASACSPVTRRSTATPTVVVMTTEVLRNMLYANSPALYGLAYVVMDEVHFLADRMRGAVWEEVITAPPEEVRLVSLSATVRQRRGVRRLDPDRPGARPSSSTSTARCRCGSTCWWASDSSICSTTRPTRGAEGQTGGRPGTQLRHHRAPARSRPDDGLAAHGPGRQPPRRPRLNRPAARAPTSSPRWTAPGLLPAITFIFSAPGATPPSNSACVVAAADHQRRSGPGSPR